MLLLLLMAWSCWKWYTENPEFSSDITVVAFLLLNSSHRSCLPTFSCIQWIAFVRKVLRYLLSWKGVVKCTYVEMWYNRRLLCCQVTFVVCHFREVMQFVIVRDETARVSYGVQIVTTSRRNYWFRMSGWNNHKQRLDRDNQVRGGNKLEKDLSIWRRSALW